MPLGLEWYTNKWLLYVVSFHGKGALSCSGLIGSERTYGTRYMDEGIPAEILRNIPKYHTLKSGYSGIFISRIKRRSER